MAFTFLKLVKVRFRAVDLFLFIQQNGLQALPIVTLISFLVASFSPLLGPCNCGASALRSMLPIS
jgi:hypothetical protein